MMQAHNYFDINTINEKTQYVLNNFKYRDKVKRIGIFGSVARGEARSNSDIDLVVDYKYDEDAIDIIAEVEKGIDFDESLREAFDPIQLSIVNMDAIIQRGDHTFKKNIETDVIWLYGKE